MAEATTVLDDSRAAAPAITKRHVAAAVVGNALEFYDFITFSLFATAIGKTFFPVSDEFTTLMSALAVFWVGFVGRPIGAFAFGRIADRMGRRPALLLSFLLMGAGLVGLSIIPSYAQIGIAAPILAVICRLIQGFALGGEVGPTMAYLVEAAPLSRRGLYGAWQSASQSIANLAGAFVGVVLASLLTTAQVNAWGWRIAFLIGAMVLPFGLFVRRSLPETLHQTEAVLDVHPADARLISHWRPLTLGVLMIMSFTTSTYVMQYMTTYALHTLHMTASVAFGASMVNGGVGFLFTLLGGALSDRFGRKPLMIWPRIFFLVATLAGFALIIRNHDATTLFLATGVIAAFSALSSGAALISLTESIRKELRGLAVGLVYAVAVTIFGGGAQSIITALIKVTGDAMAPAYYMAAMSAVGIVAMMLMRETVVLPPARTRLA